MTEQNYHFSDEAMLFRRSRRDRPEAWSDVSKTGMVAAAHYRATEAGARMLAMGGNAVDAAVASALALGVCEPAGSGLGGMTAMVIHLGPAGRTFVLEGSCRAPLHSNPKALARCSRRRGYRAVAVPTTPAVLQYALQKYGALKAEQVLAPAIALAEEGYAVTPLQHDLARRYRKSLARENAAALFLDGRLKPFLPGSRFRQPALARTLRRLAEAGFEDFYTGQIARRICRDMSQNGGFIGAQDLRDIPWPAEKSPSAVQFGNWRICTMGPPGGGLALLEMLRLFAAASAGEFDPDSPEGALLTAEIIRRARRDRRRFRLNIPMDFTGETPAFLEADYIRGAAAKIQTGVKASGETTQVSAMDGRGNAVALTQSIERVFGSKAASPQLGFLYNGYLKAFKIANKKHPHFLRPGAVARSNAAPTIVLESGRARAALGSTGSERLASGLFQVLLRLGRQSPFEAVLAPRLHCTPKGVLQLERARFSEKCLQRFRRHGFKLHSFGPFSFKTGAVQLVSLEDGLFRGVADPRRDGAAAGPERICGALENSGNF